MVTDASVSIGMPEPLRTPELFCTWVHQVLELDSSVLLRPDSRLAEELGFDSLLVFEIILAAEEDFDIEVDETLLPGTSASVADLRDAIVASAQ